MSEIGLFMFLNKDVLFYLNVGDIAGFGILSRSRIVRRERNGTGKRAKFKSDAKIYFRRKKSLSARLWSA